MKKKTNKPKKELTCYNCRHGEFIATCNVGLGSQFHRQGFNKCIYCKVCKHTCLPDKPACCNFLPENREHFLKSQHLREVKGWLIPDYTKPENERSYIRRMQTIERMAQAKRASKKTKDTNQQIEQKEKKKEKEPKRK